MDKDYLVVIQNDEFEDAIKNVLDKKGFVVTKRIFESENLIKEPYSYVGEQRFEENGKSYISRKYEKPEIQVESQNILSQEITYEYGKPVLEYKVRFNREHYTLYLSAERLIEFLQDNQLRTMSVCPKPLFEVEKTTVLVRVTIK